MAPIARASLLLCSLLLGPLGCSSEDADAVRATDDAGSSVDSEPPIDAAPDEGAVEAPARIARRLRNPAIDEAA